MADGEKAAQFSIKDVVVAVPIVASALAITWEVGFFGRIRGGSFGFFSVAEHLNFALQALPIALFITALGATALVRDHIFELLPSQSDLMQRIRVTFRNTAGKSLLLSIVGGTLAVWYFASLDLIIVVLILATGGPYVWVRILPVEMQRSVLIQSMVALTIFLCAMFVGFETAREQIKSRLPLNVIKIGEKGKEADTEIKVRILRTGERGVLYYDPGTQTFGLVSWDIVKRIDWSISPVLSLNR